jgi:hypothetical protein
MTTAIERAKGVRRWVAVVITELLAPIVLIVVLTSVVSVHAAGAIGRGPLLAVLAIFFASGLPYAIMLAGIRTGRLSDRHLRKREERPAMMAIGLASISVGLYLLDRLDAPLDLFALMVAMVAGVAVSLAISTVWKISIHTSCVAGTVVTLAFLVTPYALALLPLVLITGWARVVLLDHTRSQVLGGSVVGAAVAFSALTIVGSVASR